MTCTHDIVERDVAVTADGLCPLCLQADLTFWRDQAVKLYATLNHLQLPLRREQIVRTLLVHRTERTVSWSVPQDPNSFEPSGKP